MKRVSGLIKYILFMTIFFTAGFFISEIKTTASPVLYQHSSFYGLKAFNIDDPIDHPSESKNKFWGIPEL